MRVEFVQSIDFNQMLVYSTFVHLFFLTLVMILPSPETQGQIVVPTFRLDLIELSPKAKPASSPNKQQEVSVPPINKKAVPNVKPIAKKLKKSVLKPKAKQLPPPKTVIRESKATKKILAALESFESSHPKKSVLKELDQLARLAPKVQAKKTIPPKAIQDETFKEIERKKASELSLEPEKAKPPLLVEGPEIDAKESELAALSDQSVELDLREKTQTTSDLIKELEAMEKKKIHPADILVERAQLGEINSPSAFNSIKGESLVSVVEKFKELEGSQEEIKIDISQGRMVLKEFKTAIERGEASIPEAYSEFEASNALSLYVGQIYKRVYSYWKTPLGSKFKDVVVSFTIFSKGNINNPSIRESAGDKNLDSIAVRAILDSVPFPTLPEKLNRHNLQISIVFKYVPEKE